MPQVSGSLGQCGNTFGRAAADLFDSLQVRPVEKVFLIVDDAVARSVWAAGISTIERILPEVLTRVLFRRTCRMLWPSAVLPVSSAGTTKRVMFLGATRHDPETAAAPLVEDDPLADAQVIEAVKRKPGLPCRAPWASHSTAMGRTALPSIT
jgi:hypothetical protein